MNRLPDPRERPWLTVAEVSEITGEGQKAIRHAIAAGQIPSLSIGRYRRIPTAALHELCGIPPDMRTAGHLPARPTPQVPPATKRERFVASRDDTPPAA